MTTTEDSDVAQELYGSIPAQYLPTLSIMFALVPTAKSYFEAGNVHTAFQLLRSAPVQIAQRWRISKEQMLTAIMQALPSMYQVGDLDPSFQV